MRPIFNNFHAMEFPDCQVSLFGIHTSTEYKHIGIIARISESFKQDKTGRQEYCYWKEKESPLHKKQPAVGWVLSIYNIPSAEV